MRSDLLQMLYSSRCDYITPPDQFVGDLMSGQTIHGMHLLTRQLGSYRTVGFRSPLGAEFAF